MRTPEQHSFELEFAQWEQGFSDWKRAYEHHPDRVAYRQYEKKFLDVREKLLLKKAQIFGSPSLETQFENQLSAASQMAANILQRFGEGSTPSYGGGYAQSYGPHQSRSRSPVFRSHTQGPDHFGNQFNARNGSLRFARQGHPNISW